LARAGRRGLADTQGQAYLTATVIDTAAVIALILVVLHLLAPDRR
jgi:hypothetical protein